MPRKVLRCVMRLGITDAVGLAKADRFGESDPYCVVYFQVRDDVIDGVTHWHSRLYFLTCDDAFGR